MRSETLIEQPLRRSRWWVYASLVTLAVAVSYLLSSGWSLVVVGAAAIILTTAFAFRWAVGAAMVVLLISGGYTIFQVVPAWDIKGTTIAGGVRLEDVFMVGLLFAGVLRLATAAGRKRVGKLTIPFLLVGVWLAFEVLRNVPVAGLSAVGEMRFYYLLLAVPFCLVASIDRDSLVQIALRGFAVITVALPILLFPVVVYLKGWGFGPSARVFPANVSLGLLLGLAVLWHCRDFVPWPRTLLWTATVFGVTMIILDAHRSVWLSAAVLLVLLLWRQSVERKVRWLLLGSLVVVAIAIVADGIGYGIVGIIASRGEAVLTQQDTTGLRVSMWRATAPLIEAAPLTGRGLGLTWNLFLPEFGYTVHVYPHSLYVMVLVNLGAVGLALLAWLWVRAWRACSSIARAARRSAMPLGLSSACATLGTGVLAVIAAYGVAYGFDLYSVTLAGICFAGATLAPRPAE